jgi:methylated-DNA-[protein]-cysteine S-methyltransferase
LRKAYKHHKNTNHRPQPGLKNALRLPATIEKPTMKFDSAIVQTRIPSPLGPIFIAATTRGLTGLWFTEQQRYLPMELTQAAGWPEDAGHPVLQQASRQLGEYFSGSRRDFDLPLDLACGTAFQQSVWQVLRGIAHGEVISYGDVSRRIGNPAAVRAVGGAVGRNPVSIIVPCHRVMGSNGTLTGYGGGLARKTALLRLEGALQGSLP